MYSYLLTWVVIFINSDRRWLQKTNFKGLLKPKDENFWLPVRNLEGGNGLKVKSDDESDLKR